jgi:ketosteroid isomerase-like protein
MTREDLLRQVFDAVTRGRAREIEELVDPDMEFVSVVTGRTFRGVAGLEEWHGDVCSYYDDLAFEILEYQDLGDRDAIRWRFGGRSRATGIEFDTEMSQLWSYRDGRAARVEVFPDPYGALGAAGVDPPP